MEITWKCLICNTEFKSENKEDFEFESEIHFSEHRDDWVRVIEEEVQE
jgi:hypothetical protein